MQIFSHWLQRLPKCAASDPLGQTNNPHSGNFYLLVVLLFGSLMLMQAAHAASMPDQTTSIASISPEQKDNRRILARFKLDSPYSEYAPAAKARTLPISGVRQIKNIRSQPQPKQNQLGIAKTNPVAAPFELSVFEIVDPKLSVQQAINTLLDTGEVLYAEVDHAVSINQIPNDPNFILQWGLHNTGITGGGVADADIDALEAWDVTLGDNSVVMGVIDTGIDYRHLDLVNNMWRNPGESGLNSFGVDKASNGIDDDGNGYIDDVYGIDCSNNDADPMDDHYHGTHVAGTIGAEGNNDRQVVGVAREVSLMALKFLDEQGRGSTSDAIECLMYAANMKANHGINIRATNNSWGGGGVSQALRDAIQAQADQDILFLAAAGNRSSDTDAEPHYPASYDLPIIVSVAATDKHDGRATFSNYGANSVDVGAPGLGIVSTHLDNEILLLGGTSMAAPHVTGTVALLAAHDQNLSALQIKNRILDAADRIPSMEGVTSSGGRLNANEALRCVTGKPVMYQPISGSEFLRLGDPVLVQIRLSDCGNPVSGATVVATLSNGEPNVSLTEVSSGNYVGSYTPKTLGEVSIGISVTGVGTNLNSSKSYTVVNVAEYSINPNYVYEWHDASDGIDIGLGHVDDASTNISIGFNFNFYGIDYNDLWVHSNGMIKFGSDVGLSHFQFLHSPSNGVPNNFIAPLWEDLNPSSSNGTIYSKLLGAAPDRRLVIEWHRIEHYHKGYGFDGNVSFQVILHEGSNNIEFQYKDLTFGSPDYDDAARALIGIEFDGQDSLVYKNRGEPSSASVTDEQAILYCFEDGTENECSKTTVDDDEFCWAIKAKKTGRVASVCL